jgi:uncharacterized protein YndB with AHSA1/START domain
MKEMTVSDGQLEQVGDRWQLRFVRSLPHPPEKVWRALTEPEHLEAWFPTEIIGDRAAGAPLKFEFRNNEGPTFDGEMLAYDPPKRLEFRWGPDTLRFELEPDGDGCTLTLVDVLEELGKAARDGAGWHVCLEALRRHLDGDAEARKQMERWNEVHPAYVARFGPDAASIGPPEGKTGANG